MFWNYSDFKRYLCKVGFVAALLLGVMNSSVALNKFCRQGQSVRLSLERERERGDQDLGLLWVHSST